MKVYWRQIINQFKDGTVKVFKKLGKGVLFSDIADSQLQLIRSHCPTSIVYPVECFAIYILFHLYLLYTIIYTITKPLVLQTKRKGQRFVLWTPKFKEIKDKIYIAVTSLLVFHWLSYVSFLPFAISWQEICAWAINIRPQINIKPQVNLVRTNSCHSVHSHHSHMSFSMDQPSTSMELSLAPSEANSKSVLKWVESASRTVGTANDVMNAVHSFETASNEKNLEESILKESEITREDELDMDDELQKAMDEVESLTEDSFYDSFESQSEEYEYGLETNEGPVEESNTVNSIINSEKEISNEPKSNVTPDRLSLGGKSGKSVGVRNRMSLGMLTRATASSAQKTVEKMPIAEKKAPCFRTTAKNIVNQLRVIGSKQVARIPLLKSSSAKKEAPQENNDKDTSCA